MKLKLFISTFILIPIIETLFISIYVSEFYAPLFVVWAIGSWYFNLSYKTTLSLSSEYLIFALVFIYRGENFYANRLAIWFYLFFSLSIAFAFFEKIGLKKRINEKVSPLASFQSILSYVIFKSKYLIYPLTFSILAAIYYQLINQARYYYWFFYFDKFQKYFRFTVVYEIAFFLILIFVFYKIVKYNINKRLLIIVFMGCLSLGNMIIFNITTRPIEINGDEPSLAEIKEEEGFLYLYGHNFRRWPDEHSLIYIDGQSQDFVFWSSDLIVLKPSVKKEERKQIWLTNSLELTSKKARFDQF